MKHDFLSIALQQDKLPIKISKRNAYHVAGQTAAIYLGNQSKRLPSISFEIVFQNPDQKSSVQLTSSPKCHPVKVKGGRLIQNLPPSFDQVTRSFTTDQRKKYQCAFEADIINLLIGPLAEAKYVALRDDEVFNTNLINLKALRFYDADMQVIEDYMQCYLADQNKVHRKLSELFVTAFKFVDYSSNWRAIHTLADWLLTEPKHINGKEMINVLESTISIGLTKVVENHNEPTSHSSQRIFDDREWRSSSVIPLRRSVDR